MPDNLKTFSESWHLVANLRVSLKTAVSVRKQYFRSEVWYKFHDPFTNQFFRMGPAGYRFIMYLRKDRTIEETWNYCIENDPANTPGQEQVIKLLSQLYSANLLHCQLPPDSAKLFSQYKKRKQKEIQSQLRSIMFIRIPLFDPEPALKYFMPLINLIVGWLGLIIWLTVITGALKMVFDRFDMVLDQFQSILAPGNLFMLYAGIVLIKTVHELGHAIICKKYGGEVHTIGVMFLVFVPLPFMDASSSWGFRSRWHRILVSAGGIIFELFVAGICAFVWAKTGSGTVHSLAYNMMLVASVSTLLFNINPLLKLDGYYILSDILDIPNLHQRVKLHFTHIVERYIFGLSSSFSPSGNIKEAAILMTYGIPSFAYRLLIYTGIILFIADKFFIFGLILALSGIINWGLVPLIKFINYLFFSPKLIKNRFRAVFITFIVFTTIFSAISLIPFPKRFKAPGIIESANHTRVINQSPGYIQEILVPTGEQVRAGTDLVKLINHELELELQSSYAKQEEISAKLRKAVQESTADMLPLEKTLEAIKHKHKDIERKYSGLIIKARQDGTWIAPELEHHIGAWLNKGMEIGRIVDQTQYHFSAVVPQSECANLFTNDEEKVEIRVFGQGDKNMPVNEYKIIPFQQDQLPSAAIGWQGGGEISTDPEDNKGLKTDKPFFQIIATIDNDNNSPSAEFYHGISGKIRITMPPVPLLKQVEQKLRQLFQERYQI
jgi:putative peptide zinc metalloprotease protein